MSTNIFAQLSVTPMLYAQLSQAPMIINDWVITVEDIEGGKRLVARRGSETQTMEIMDGAKGDKGDKGEQGIPGYTPQKGVDYFDGETGPAGTGVKSTLIAYARGSSGTVIPTSGWSTFIPEVPAGEFLWSRTRITYTDNIESNIYGVSKIGSTGPQGEQGIQGEQGVPGVAGAPGEPGASAYEIAVENGFEGTEAEWLESLKGEGGGGDADWAVNDPDASGYVKNRTHWVEESMVYVMPVQAYVADEETGGAAQITSPLPDSIVAGAELVVNYNGTDYPAVVSAITLEGYDTLAFGCYGALTGGEMTADPYAFIVMPEETAADSGVYAAILPLDGSTGFAFGVKAEGEVVHTLDEKYIPISVKAPTITITKQNDNYTVDYPFEGAWAMSENMLQSAIVYVDKDSSWIERLSAASVSKLGAPPESEFAYDTIQITLEPYDDTIGHAIRKLCLAWARFPVGGPALIGVHQDLVLLNADDIPDSIAGPGLTASADNKLEIMVGEGLEVVDDKLGVKQEVLDKIESLSEDKADHFEVGDGLTMSEDRVLSVHEDKWELIEEITLEESVYGFARITPDLEAIRLDIYTPNTAAANGGVSLEVRDSYNALIAYAWYGSLIQTGKNTYTTFECITDGDEYVAESTQPTQPSSVYAASVLRSRCIQQSGSFIQYFKLFGDLLKDTKIIIKGVRT